MYSILVIDDEESIRSALHRILSAEGYAVKGAADIASGLEACIRYKPDLVFLDVNLPDGKGTDLCRRLKADPQLRHIPVFILTGEYIEVENRLEGLEAGADDYIVKPFSQAEIVLRVRRILKDAPAQ